MDVHLMGVVCVEALRFFNLAFGKKSLCPTVHFFLPLIVRHEPIHPVPAAHAKFVLNSGSQ